MAPIEVPTTQLVNQPAVPSGMFYGVAHVRDAQGNLIAAWIEFPPENNNVTSVMVRKHVMNGPGVLKEWRVRPKSGFKLDDLSVSLQGTTLTIVGVTHTSVAGEARRRAVELAIIQNV